MDSYTKEIVDFIFKEGGETYQKEDREFLEEIVRKHLEYKTIMTIRDKEGIIAVARWNENKTTALVLDAIVKKEHRNGKMMKYLIALAENKMPYLKKIQFDREIKYPFRQRKEYSMSRILRKKEIVYG